MTSAVLLSILVLFDAGLAGFRAAAGRDGRIAKGPYFRMAVARSFGGALGVLAFNAAVVALLVVTASSTETAWATLTHAAELCVWIFGVFATVTLAAFALWFSPIEEYRLLSTVIVLGPLTLIRPLIIVGGLAAVCIAIPDVRVIVTAVIAGATMLAFEHLVGRTYAERWRRLV